MTAALRIHICLVIKSVFIKCLPAGGGEAFYKRKIITAYIATNRI